MDVTIQCDTERLRMLWDIVKEYQDYLDLNLKKGIIIVVSKGAVGHMKEAEAK